MKPIEKLHWLERELKAAGFPPMSRWWVETFVEFYRTNKRTLVLRVGRRGGKSTSISRVLLLEALFGDHYVPPGDIATIAIVSISLKEARKRLILFKKMLTALNIGWDPCDDGIVFRTSDEKERAVCVYPATIGGVSGFTCIGCLCDEEAKWYDRETGVNPATEVLASLSPTMADQRNAKMFQSSSPLGRLDAHAKAFDRGDDALQMVKAAPTWVARPEMTEAYTHTLESNLDIWSREYGAVPLEGAMESVFAPVSLDKCTRPQREDIVAVPGYSYIAAIDPASRGNGFTLVVCGNDGRRRQVVMVREWRGSQAQPLDLLAVMREISVLVRPYGVRTLLSDQWSGDALAVVARLPEVGLGLVQRTLTRPEKLDKFADLSRSMALGLVEIPTHPQLRADLLNVVRVVTASGMTIELRSIDGRHADFASAMLLAWMTPCAEPDPEVAKVDMETLEQAMVRRAIGDRDKARDPRNRFAKLPDWARARVR